MLLNINLVVLVPYHVTMVTVEENSVATGLAPPVALTGCALEKTTAKTAASFDFNVGA